MILTCKILILNQRVRYVTNRVNIWIKGSFIWVNYCKNTCLLESSPHKYWLIVSSLTVDRNGFQLWNYDRSMLLYADDNIQPNDYNIQINAFSCYAVQKYFQQKGARAAATYILLWKLYAVVIVLLQQKCIEIRFWSGQIQLMHTCAYEIDMADRIPMYYPTRIICVTDGNIIVYIIVSSKHMHPSTYMI